MSRPAAAPGAPPRRCGGGWSAATGHEHRRAGDGSFRVPPTAERTVRVGVRGPPPARPATPQPDPNRPEGQPRRSTSPATSPTVQRHRARRRSPPTCRSGAGLPADRQHRADGGRQGNRIEVTSASSNHERRCAPSSRPHGAAAGTQGGLLRPAARVARCRPGTTVTARRRVHPDPRRAGLRPVRPRARTTPGGAAAQPLLAWERGVGWHTEPLLQYTAESATSEAARTDLTVTAPGTYTVLSTGDPGRPGRLRRRRPEALARDRRPGPGRERRGRPVPDREGDRGRDDRAGRHRAGQGAAEAADRGRAAACGELSARYGPAPFPSITVARLPISGGGIEYPSAILLLDDSRVVTVHELAHQWFYAMVGNSQARDPWLDEAFATFTEEEIDGTTATTRGALKLPGKVGDSTTALRRQRDRVLQHHVREGGGRADRGPRRRAAGQVRRRAALLRQRERVADREAGRPGQGPGRPAGVDQGAPGRRRPAVGAPPASGSVRLGGQLLDPGRRPRPGRRRPARTTAAGSPACRTPRPARPRPRPRPGSARPAPWSWSRTRPRSSWPSSPARTGTRRRRPAAPGSANPGTSRSIRYDRLPPPVEGRAHLVHRAQVAADRGQRRRLRDVRDVARSGGTAGWSPP